jgi:hypothetical protein
LRESLFPIHHSPLAFVFPHKRRREAERRQTLITILRILRCGSRLHEARSSDGVPPRLSPKGVSHPKGSASGQASWDAV